MYRHLYVLYSERALKYLKWHPRNYGTTKLCLAEVSDSHDSEGNRTSDEALYAMGATFILHLWGATLQYIRLDEVTITVHAFSDCPGMSYYPISYPCTESRAGLKTLVLFHVWFIDSPLPLTFSPLLKSLVLDNCIPPPSFYDALAAENISISRLSVNCGNKGDNDRLRKISNSIITLNVDSNPQPTRGARWF